MNRKLFGKYDIIIILALVAVALAFLAPKLFSTERLTAVISQNGETVETVDLSEIEESYEIELDGAVILVEKNAVSFKEADCPDRLCVKCGKLSHIGDTAVCVPTATVVTITGNGEKQVDAVSY
jgi:hypothetical protein